MAHEGHVVIKTVDDAGMMICYLPELVTDNQNMWFYEHMNFFNQYSSVNGFQIVSVDDDTYRGDKLHGLDAIMREINQRNILSSKKGCK